MKYQKKYSTASDYQSDTHETNSVSMVSTDTLYYDGTAIQTNTSSGGNIIVEEDGLYQIKDGEIYPVSHPDLSTQPSLLPYRIGQKAVYQVMIPSSEFLDTRISSEGHIITLPLKYLDTCIVSVTGYMDVLYSGGDGTSYSSGVPYTIYYSCAGVIAQQNGNDNIAIPDFLIVTYASQLEEYYSGSSGPTILRSLRISDMIPAEQRININIIIPDSNPDVDSIIGETVITTASNYTISVPITCITNGSSISAESLINDTNIYIYPVVLSYDFHRQNYSTMQSPAALNVNGGSVTINLYI